MGEINTFFRTITPLGQLQFYKEVSKTDDSEFKHHGKLATVSRELFSSWFAWIGIIIFLLLLAYIIGVPIYLAVNNIDVLSPIAGSNGNILNNATPSAQYIFGTDSFGNNMLLLIGVGVGTSLALAIAVTVLCTIIGTTLGIIGGGVFLRSRKHIRSILTGNSKNTDLFSFNCVISNYLRTIC